MNRRDEGTDVADLFLSILIGIVKVAGAILFFAVSFIAAVITQIAGGSRR